MPIRRPAGEAQRMLGIGLTAAKMAECKWLMDLHLRHTPLIALRDDKPAGQVTREQG